MIIQSCLLLVEIPDNAWKYDKVAEGYPDAIGVKMVLEILHCAYSDLDGMGFPRIRIVRVRSQAETGQVMRQLDQAAHQQKHLLSRRPRQARLSQRGDVLSKQAAMANTLIQKELVVVSWRPIMQNYVRQSTEYSTVRMERSRQAA